MPELEVFLNQTGIFLNHGLQVTNVKIILICDITGVA